MAMYMIHVTGYNHGVFVSAAIVLSVVGVVVVVIVVVVIVE